MQCNKSQSALESALLAASKGWRVFPTTIDKKPACLAFTLIATTDPDVIRELFRKNAHKGIVGYGIHPVGYVAIDFDMVGGEASLNAAGYETPTTFTIKSGNQEKEGRYTIVYKLPPGLRLKIDELKGFKGFKDFDGIDIRSSGGQIQGPGSLHKTGGYYSIQNDCDPVPAPEWLIKLSEPENEKYVRIWTEEEALEHRKITKKVKSKSIKTTQFKNFDYDYDGFLDDNFPIKAFGQRHSVVNKAILALRRKKLDKESVIKLLTEWLLRHKDNFGITVEDAIHRMIITVENTVRREEEGIVKYTDHEVLTANLTLNSYFQKIFDQCTGLPVNPNMLGLTSTNVQSEEHEIKDAGFDVDEEKGKKVKVIKKKLKEIMWTDEEKLFFLAMLKNIQYCLVVKGEDTIKWTTDQARAIYSLVSGKEITPVSAARQRYKFISRLTEKGDELIEATHFEFLVMTSRGVRDKASEFVAPWLDMDLLKQEEKQDGDVKPGVGEEGEQGVSGVSGGEIVSSNGEGDSPESEVLEAGEGHKEEGEEDSDSDPRGQGELSCTEVQSDCDSGSSISICGGSTVQASSVSDRGSRTDSFKKKGGRELGRDEEMEYAESFLRSRVYRDADYKSGSQETEHEYDNTLLTYNLLNDG